MEWLWRHDVHESDIENIRELIAATGFFSAEEIQVAGELVEARLKNGVASGYEFLVVEHNGQLMGYTCYGVIPMTDRRYDLYWIAVSRPFQNKGLGRELLLRTEELIKSSGGLHLYAETAGRQQYLPTQQFYVRQGYERVAELDDFYKEGDSKIIYRKQLK